MCMLDEIKCYKFFVNLFEINASYYQEDIQNIFIPLLKQLTELKKSKCGRLLVYLVAPPGAGKSTLAAFLEFLSINTKDVEEIQSIGIDGFHYPQKHIKNNKVIIRGRAVPMEKVKGSPETFDLDKLKVKIQTLKSENVTWPIYDRTLHDVIEDQILVSKDIVLVEGNWLLLNERGWKELKEYCDYSISIEAEEAMLKDRLIKRKIRGGLLGEDAIKFYEESDKENVKRVITNSSSADLQLELTSNGKYKKGDNLNGT